MHRYLLFFIYLSLSMSSLVGCGDDDSSTTDTMSSSGSDASTSGGDASSSGGSTGTHYDFESRFQPGESSVSYSGQVARQVLISDLKDYIGGLTDRVDADSSLADAQGKIIASLDYYYRFDSDAYGAEALRLTTDPAPLQETYADVSSGKNLISKLAGQDTATDHVDWSRSFSGWSDATIAENGGAIDSPAGLMEAFFETLEENAIARANGVSRLGPNGVMLPIHVTVQGQDLQQLTQKFLLVAINFHQAADDYLDSDVDGKGLRSDNAEPDSEGAKYSSLEHGWDEAFGYFGAARNYADYSDDELAAEAGREGWSEGYHDTNNDGRVDLNAEYNFGASTNAAKRDRGSAEGSMTDFTAEAFDAFRAGRALITEANGALDATQMQRLEAHRDAVIITWEKALAATSIHYINDVLGDMEKFGSDDYDFLHHAKVWSELKGFALAFQFNPRSPLTDAQFAQLHQLIGDAPALPGADEATLNDYQQALLTARDLLRGAYGFSNENAIAW